MSSYITPSTERKKKQERYPQKLSPRRAARGGGLYAKGLRIPAPSTRFEENEVGLGLPPGSHGFGVLRNEDRLNDRRHATAHETLLFS